MQSYSLTPAETHHVEQIQGWFNDAKELLTWGGSGLTLAVTAAEFACQIKLSSLASYVLLDGDEVVAFGQYYVRMGRHHFGRLAVSPTQRGKGIAYLLLHALAKNACRTQQASGFSLFVFPDNKVAMRTYQRCGFTEQAYPEQIPGGLSDCLYMVAEQLTIPQTIPV